MRLTAFFILLITLSISPVFAQTSLLFKGFNFNTSGDGNPSAFIQFGNKFIFANDDGINGKELWISDGTAAGSYMIKDINPGPPGSTPNNMVVMNGKVYFGATEAVSGNELWVTDGTTAGTQMVKDIYAGGNGFQDGLRVYNGKLIFRAVEPVAGSELWISDGTEAGTNLLKDIRPGIQYSTPQHFYEFDGKLFFAAFDGTYGIELWVTDGSAAGTRMLKDLAPGSLYSNPDYFLTRGAQFLFIASGELWSSTGTAVSTRMVKKINPAGTSITNPHWTVCNGKVYFQANDGIHGSELWVTDGSAYYTQMVADINPGSTGSAPSYITALNGKIYFRANDGIAGDELWVSDGTPSGTTLVKDLCPATGTGSSITNMTVYKNHLYFVASQCDLNDRQLWQSDGTGAGTTIITPPGGTLSSPAVMLKEYFTYKVDSSLYFNAHFDVYGEELWKITDTAWYPSKNIAGIETSPSFSLYPNPNDGTFTIQFDNQHVEKSNVAVYDVLGREVYQSPISNSRFQITLNQPKGIYLVKLQLDDAVLTKRVMVE